MKLTDQANGTVIADAIKVVPTPGQGGTGGTPALYYVYPDHLGTPRVVANAANQPVWRWDNVEPFGDTPPQENPSGLGAFEFALRFPGQYQDRETGLSYNYFRDYDPQTGRYVQSDPIGLAGDINVYRYSRNNPLTYFDPDGAQATSAMGGSGAFSSASGVGAGSRAMAVLGPVGLVAGAGVGGYQLGGIFYPYIAEPLGRAIDAVCLSESSAEECDKEWREARRVCRELIY